MFKIFVLTLFIGSIQSATDYCSKDLCGNKKHIACGNSGNFYPACPADREMVEMGDKEIQQILKVHNKLRNKIANGDQNGFSPASRMATMTWNKELAMIASLNVKQCKMEHDQCRSTMEYPNAGQNLASQSGTGGFEAIDSFIKNSIEGWYNEVSNAAQSDIDKCCSSASGKVIGHFTQVVTDRAIQVGCAISQYTKPGGWKTSLMACNYALINMVGEKVYKSGNAASGCTKGTNSDFPALCNKNEPISVKL